MAAPTIIRSTDSAAVSAGAILTGNAGSLVAVLDYALVTVLGWGKAFTATNKGVYRAPAGVRHYLDVDDSAPDATALGRNARIRGYETMSAVGTGTNPFPTVAQVTTCVGLIKSTATGTTARPWIVVGDDRTFYFFSEAAGTDPPTLSTHAWTDGFYFGEILSVIVGDLYRTVYGWNSTVSTFVTALMNPYNSTAASTTTVINVNMPRSYTGSGTSLWAQPVGNLFSVTNLSLATGNFTYPNPADSGFYLNVMNVVERGSGTTAAAASSAATGIRGQLRGVCQSPFNSTGVDDQTTFSGAAGTVWAGKTFIALRINTDTGRTGLLVFETTPWAASS